MSASGPDAQRGPAAVYHAIRSATPFTGPLVESVGRGPQHLIPQHTKGRKRRFWIHRLGVSEQRKARKYHVGSGAAPPTTAPNYLYLCTLCGVGSMGRVSWNYARHYCVGSGVAPQPPIPAHTMGQKLCFHHRMGAFETKKKKRVALHPESVVDTVQRTCTRDQPSDKKKEKSRRWKRWYPPTKSYSGRFWSRGGGG